MRSTALVTVLSLFLEVTSDDKGFCSVESRSDCEGDKLKTYSPLSNEILAKIEAAEAGYVECKEGGCKCYEAVIDTDLAKFPRVTRQMLLDIRDFILL